jgi:DNA-cytosine methyltransferase
MNRDNDQVLRVLELYSGIGGMHYGLEMSGLNYKVVAAIDINPNANSVYNYNFNKKGKEETKVLQKTIDGIKVNEFDDLRIDLITMSPPCQPFSRQGQQNGSNDNRSISFQYLLDILPLLSYKPKYILMENVKGFEQSDTHRQFIQFLNSLSFNYQQFLLSPVQFGIPNSRLRYFLIAKSNELPMKFEINKNEIMTTIPKEFKNTIEEMRSHLLETYKNNNINIKTSSYENSRKEINNNDDDFLEIESYQLHEDYKQCVQTEEENMIVSNVLRVEDFLDRSSNDNKSVLTLENSKDEKSIRCSDIITGSSTRTNCFTKK